ncbi:hypothetical protein GLOIN_2v1874888 [Rhizophagus irregularis DAOM 181602=DAOM 197198]|nr:hypothetical protein GLOIN_2v1874888 [Rhizophagus irregularis DAOM 181602=DAOM 197198]
MDLYVYNLDEYTTNSRQGNEFAPSWPFRLAVAGSSDSGKTTMIINLLMGDKKAKEDGERYILCDAVILVGRYLDEPKWAVVRDFFKEEEIPFTAVSHSEIPNVKDFNSTQATVVIFEDLMDAPKKIQDLITGFFTHGRHKKYLVYLCGPKILYHSQGYSIIRQYTEESESLAPVIDDLTLQREFIVFDLRRSKSDPLSIRVRWDTSLSSITDQSQFDPKRKHLLVSGVIAKNADTWIKYVFWEAYGLSGKTLGSDFQNFLAKVRDRTTKTEIPKPETVKESFLRVIWTVEHYE